MKRIVTALLALTMAGCQTYITATKNPESILPLTKTVTAPDGTVTVTVTGYVTASGGWKASARSPLWAAESLRGLDIGVETNGTVHLILDDYSRDLSTNAVVMTKTIFDGSTNLVTAIGKAYALIAGGGSTEVVSAVANKAAAYFKEKGGDASKSTVTCENGVCSVSDGNVCIVCDADGNCSVGSCGE